MFRTAGRQDLKHSLLTLSTRFKLLSSKSFALAHMFHSLINTLVPNEAPFLNTSRWAQVCQQCEQAASSNKRSHKINPKAADKLYCGRINSFKPRHQLRWACLVSAKLTCTKARRCLRANGASAERKSALFSGQMAEFFNWHSISFDHSCLEIQTIFGVIQLHLISVILFS